MRGSLGPTGANGDSSEPNDDEIDRTAGRTWFAGGIFVGFGASPAVGLAIYAVAQAFFGRSVSILVVLAAALVSFALGLAYVALARTLEP